MQYEENYLKEVIFRIDFTKPLPQKKQLVDKFYKLVMHIFPNNKIVTHTMIQAQVINQKDGNKVTQSTQKVKNNRLSDENQEKILMLEPLTDINLKFNIYKNSTELNAIIGTIIDALIAVYGNIEIKRTGLRYINDISLSEGNTFDWGHFINPKLISNLDFPSEKNDLLRVLGIIELNRESHKVLFQYGMYNPDYPNPVAQKVFVLDFDCYTTVPLDASEIKETIKILQKDEERLFERSIEDGLRDKMVVVNDDRPRPI